MENQKNQWKQLILDSLSSEDADARLFALDFLSNQNTLTKDVLLELMPLLSSSAVHTNNKVRYFARRAKAHIIDCYPELNAEESRTVCEIASQRIKDADNLTSQEILLHKLYLGSRYVVFDSIDRLTESGDKALVEPLLKYLQEERDPYKLSYLVKRLGRFDDERVLAALEAFLEHSDERVVANTLEAYCDFEYPKIQGRLMDLALSQDNRVRGNAVRALYRYAPKVAEQHVAEMVKSKNIALQDSGVFLLGCLRPSNLGELLEIACGSRYSSVRLKAMQITPPTEEEKQNIRMLLKEDVEKIDPRRDALFLLGAFLIAAMLLGFETETNKHILVMIFMGIGSLLMLRPDTTRTSIQKSALSMGFLASLAWGSTHLMIIPGLMGLWLTWNEGRINKRGNPEKASQENIVAWFFVMGAIILTQLIVSDKSVILRLACKLGTSADTGVMEGLQSVIRTQYHFDMILFVFISIMTVGIVRFKSWFPLKRDEAGKIIESIANKKLLMVACVFLFLIAFLCSVQFATSTLQTKVIRQKTPVEILKTVINSQKSKK
jgi:hypothetical protein